MDTVRTENGNYMLPSARALLFSTAHQPERRLSAEDGNSMDRMVIDEPYESSETNLTSFNQENTPKPHLPPITNIQAYPSSAHSQIQPSPYHASTLGTHTSDELLRHRMSDMSVSGSHHRASVGIRSPRGMSPAREAAIARALSPLEPNSQYDLYSRRGSTADTIFPSMEYRRPSITDIGSLPHPTSANVSRRGSVATVATEYDHPSRSPSPSPFGKRFSHEPADSGYYINRRDSLPLAPHPAVAQVQAYDPFQRRHSIATAEPAYSNGSNGLPNVRPPMNNPKIRASFRFPATIQETPHGPYSAPSSPPPSSSTPTLHDPSNTTLPQPPKTPEAISNATRYPRHGMRHISSSGTDNHYQQQQQQQRNHAHPYAPTGNPLVHNRRKSIMTDEAALDSSPSLGRRASMPVVTMRRHPSTQDLPHPHPYPPTPTRLQHKIIHDESPEPTDSSLGYYPDNSDSYLNHDDMGGDPSEEDKSGNKSETPYSRSPELRVSHKLAERKRRKEMKELFDELRDSLPVEKNLKTSKWEILSKAVEYIAQLKHRDYNMETELAGLRREVASMKRDRGSSSNYGPSF
ncbi:helix-loop-helix DNA-binding domain-containing transcription factor [Phycomyces blakesleeanus]